MIGALSGSIFVPEFKLIIPEKPIPKTLIWFGMVREIGDYDIRDDSFLLRHDVLSRIHNIQLHVTHRIDRISSKEGIAEARLVSEKNLFREMKERGIKLSDLDPLPIPPGYMTPHFLNT